MSGRPAVAAVTEAWYEELEPLVENDEENGWATLILIDALAHLVQPLEDIVRDTDAGPGYSGLLDPARAPSEALDWLAMIAGLRLPQGLDDLTRRARIAKPGPAVGTPAAIVAAAQPFLTGTRSVLLFEREGGPWRLTVATRASETPDPAAVEQAIRAQKPIGIVLTYTVISGQAWNEATPSATWSSVGSLTWDQAKTTNI